MKYSKVLLIYTLVSLFLILLPSLCKSETIYLKNGKEVKGEIVSKKEDCISINKKVGDGIVTVTYYKDEIVKIGSEEKEGKERGGGLNLEYIAQKSERLLKNDQYEKVISFLKKAIENRSPPSDILAKLGEAYYRTQKLDKALTYFNKSIKQNPNLVDVYLKIADIYSRQEEYNKKIDILKKALGKASSSKKKEIYEKLGYVFLLTNKFKTADSYFKKAYNEMKD